ncbi:MAG: acyltransferase [Salinibacterium sp.]|nr:MAG: acyltransferase [Salinibacterium sp.]
MTLPEHSRSRVPSLDGLRGIAAGVVVLHHLARVIPSISTGYLHRSAVPAVGSLHWWVSYTPMKLLTAGPEAVLIFFVLSGFVLALSPVRRRDFAWASYYPKRIVRLFLPAIAAILFGTALTILVPRELSVVHGPWLARLFEPGLSPLATLKDFTIVFGWPFRTNNVLWSLVWEVWFSLLLPLFVVLAVVLKRAWWVLIPVGLAVCLAGQLTHQHSLVFLPVFVIGVALARGRDDLAAVAHRIDSLSAARLIWGSALVLSLLLILSSWLMEGLWPGAKAIGPVSQVLATFGAASLVAICALWSGAARALTWRPIAWLGRVSFSLYLVHIPIVLSLAYLLGDRQWILIAAIALPLSLIAAELFFRFVELPSQRLSVATGRLFERSRVATRERSAERPVPVTD